MARNKYPEETRRKILDIAFRLFSEKGYEHTTIQDIVDRLGMSKGAVYHHFKSKEDILDHLYDRYYVDSGMLSDTLNDPGLTGLEKLRRLLLWQLSDQGKLEIDAISASSSSRADPQLLQLMLVTSMKESAPIVQKLLEEGIADGSITTPYPRELSQAVLVLLNMWVGVFPGSREEFEGKFRFLKALTDSLGVPVFDKTLMEIIGSYYDHFSDRILP